MKQRFLGLGWVLCSFAALACGSSAGDSSNSADEAYTSSLTAEIEGSWVLQGGLVEGLDLRPDHTFFRDTTRVLNGMWINGGPPMKRDTGTWHAKRSTQTLTLSVDGGDVEVYTMDYTAAPVLNGMFLPGHEPAATLVLTDDNGASQTFKHASSWCTSDDDCATEQSDRTWATSGDGTPTCDATTHACSLASNGPPPGRCAADGDCDEGQHCNRFVMIVCQAPPYCGVCVSGDADGGAGDDGGNGHLTCADLTCESGTHCCAGPLTANGPLGDAFCQSDGSFCPL
jgi:hypothetical protein